MHIIFQVWEDFVNVKKNSHLDISVVTNATITFSYSGPKSGKMERVVSGRASNVTPKPKLYMRITNMNTIPDLSRPGLTTTATDAIHLQGAGENLTTLG